MYSILVEVILIEIRQTLSPDHLRRFLLTWVTFFLLRKKLSDAADMLIGTSEGTEPQVLLHKRVRD